MPAPSESSIVIPGLHIGHAGDPAVASGVTALVFDGPATASGWFWVAHPVAVRPGCWRRK